MKGKKKKRYSMKLHRPGLNLKMKKQFNIEKLIVILIAVKLGVSAMILQSHEKDIAAISFGTPVYAQENVADVEKKMPEKKMEAQQAASREIDLDILKSIEQKEQDLKKREQVLKKQEEELKLLTVEIEKKLSKIKSAQSRIEELVALREDLVEKSIKHLVKVYSSMKPAEAGPLIEKLDKGITIQILSKMKGKDAGKILARVNPNLAAKLSEEIAKRK